MKVSINPLDPNSMIEAAKQIREYAEALEWKNASIVAALAEKGETLARAHLATVSGDAVEGNSVTFSHSDSSSGMKASGVVEAGGQAAYIEFGTGTLGEGTYPKGNPWEYNVPSSFKRKDVNGVTYWVYNGTKMYGWASYPFMYDTGADLHKLVEPIAKEVFKS